MSHRVEHRPVEVFKDFDVTYCDWCDAALVTVAANDLPGSDAYSTGMVFMAVQGMTGTLEFCNWQCCSEYATKQVVPEMALPEVPLPPEVNTATYRREKRRVLIGIHEPA